MVQYNNYKDDWTICASNLWLYHVQSDLPKVACLRGRTKKERAELMFAYIFKLLPKKK